MITVFYLLINPIINDPRIALLIAVELLAEWAILTKIEKRQQEKPLSDDWRREHSYEKEGDIG